MFTVSFGRKRIERVSNFTTLEVKWDGVRTIAWIDGERLRLVSRRKRAVTDLYPSQV